MESVTRSSDRLRKAVVVPAMVVPFLFSWLYFVILPGTWIGNALYVSMKILLVLWPMVATGWILKEGWPGVRAWLERPRGGGLGTALGWGSLMGAAVLLLMGALMLSPLGDMVREGAARIRVRVEGMGVLDHFLWFALFLSVVHSLIEEVYWRGFVFGNLRRWLPLGWAHVVAGLAFCAHHVVVLSQFFSLGMACFLGFSVGVGGVLWSVLYVRHGTLLGAWLSHMIVDFGIMALGAHLMGLL